MYLAILEQRGRAGEGGGGYSIFIQMNMEHNVNSLIQKMDGWMTCNFTFFSAVFQSYQDDERVIMKSCAHVQWNPNYGREDFALGRARTLDR